MVDSIFTHLLEMNLIINHDFLVLNTMNWQNIIDRSVIKSVEFTIIKAFGIKFKYAQSKSNREKLINFQKFSKLGQ